MYTVYFVFTFIIFISFITGNILSITEHKQKNNRLILEEGKIIDEEIL